MSDEVKLVAMIIFVLLISVISAVGYNKLMFSKNDNAIPTMVAILLGISIFGIYGIMIL